MKAERYVAMVHRSMSDITKIFRDGKDVSVGRLKIGFNMYTVIFVVKMVSFNGI